MDFVDVDGAWVVECLPDGPRGDFVEHDPVDNLGASVLKFLVDVPGDRLALPVGVRCQEDLIDPFGRLLELSKRLGLSLDDLVVGLKPLLNVDSEARLRQVLDVAHRGLDRVVVAQVSLQGPGLGR